mmetsp:Transcript_11608/g.38375  ORF Transcript_11608/g.38375 Transcript_11608/m.38375 type:complete len:235 (+) Transcript_11608:569-1273(+)
MFRGAKRASLCPQTTPRSTATRPWVRCLRASASWPSRCTSSSCSPPRSLSADAPCSARRPSSPSPPASSTTPSPTASSTGCSAPSSTGRSRSCSASPTRSCPSASTTTSCTRCRPSSRATSWRWTRRRRPPRTRCCCTPRSRPGTAQPSPQSRASRRRRCLSSLRWTGRACRRAPRRGRGWRASACLGSPRQASHPTTRGGRRRHRGLWAPLRASPPHRAHAYVAGCFLHRALR